MIKVISLIIAFVLIFIIEPVLENGIQASSQKIILPIGTDRTADYSKWSKKIIGRYGDHRKSYVQGHKHSGIDIQGNLGETVYPIANGTVVKIFREFPNQTIYIQHKIGENTIIFSVYIHVEDIQINTGDRVSEKTPIARIFNQEELAAADFGTPPHLHFEIRHNIDDRGEATFKSMTLKELNKYCIDPLIFFKNPTLNF